MAKITPKRNRGNKKENFCQPGFFRFGQLGQKILLTNEVGDFIFLNKKQFADFKTGKIKLKSQLGKKLDELDFLKHDVPCGRMVERFREKNQHFISLGPSLHIVVVTLRCNHRCVYCQTSSHSDDKKTDMTKKTAKKVVDFIFSSPNPNLAIEFQGGEPLLNWPTVKFIVDYARQKNKKAKKNLELRLVSNFSVMTEAIARHLFKQGVSFCTSLDGPAKLHNQNRAFNGQSYAKVSFWLKKLVDEYEKRRQKDKDYIFQPAAVLTVSRHTLKYPREIVDEYLKWKIDNMAIRPVNSFGVAKKDWPEVGYTPEEFFSFYKKALDYILQKNEQGTYFKEMIAMVAARKILRRDYETYLDLRSPCGAVIGQLSYLYDGSIYSCDEGRMTGEDAFVVGNVLKDNYQKIISSPRSKALCVASCLENTVCDFCVFKPYCGVCPVFNYVNYGNIFAPAPLSDRCKINKMILGHVFKLLQDPKKKKILELWADREKWNLAVSEKCL